MSSEEDELRAELERRMRKTYFGQVRELHDAWMKLACQVLDALAAMLAKVQRFLHRLLR